MENDPGSQVRRRRNGPSPLLTPSRLLVAVLANELFFYLCDLGLIFCRGRTGASLVWRLMLPLS